MPPSRVRVEAARVRLVLSNDDKSCLAGKSTRGKAGGSEDDAAGGVATSVVAERYGCGRIGESEDNATCGVVEGIGCGVDSWGSGSWGTESGGSDSNRCSGACGERGGDDRLDPEDPAVSGACMSGIGVSGILMSSGGFGWPNFHGVLKSTCATLTRCLAYEDDALTSSAGSARGLHCLHQLY